MIEHTWEQVQEMNRETVEKCPEGYTTVWSVATGMVDVFKKESREAARFVKKQSGFLAVHVAPDGRGVLWLFDTEKNARNAKYEMTKKGILTGNFVCALNVEKKYLEG